MRWPAKSCTVSRSADAKACGLSLCARLLSSTSLTSPKHRSTAAVPPNRDTNISIRLSASMYAGCLKRRREWPSDAIAVPRRLNAERRRPWHARQRPLWEARRVVVVWFCAAVFFLRRGTVQQPVVVLRPAVQAAAKGGARAGIVAKEGPAHVCGVLLEASAQRPDEDGTVLHAHRVAWRGTTQLGQVAWSTAPVIDRPIPRTITHDQIAMGGFLNHKTCVGD